MNGNRTTLYIVAASVAALAAYLYWRQTNASSTGDASGSSGGGTAGASDSGPFAGLTSAFQSIGEALGVTAPKGIRNNNPGNIRYVASIPWQGQTGDDGTGYAVFDSPENGVRALGHQLRTYIGRGVNTIDDILDPNTGKVIRKGIIPTYAPSSENNTQAYVDDVVSRTGRSAAEPLDEADIPALAVAIVWHENGQNPYGDDAVAQWAMEA